MANKNLKKLSDLIPDDKNFNKGSEFGNGLIEMSFRKFGAGRSILLDKNNRIIAGNKSVENAAAIGMEDVQIVESDGKRIIAVKRTDIDLDSPEGREMAFADNASAKANIVFDAQLVEAELGVAICQAWGVEPPINQEVEEDEFEVPDGGLETTIKLGDIFEIGPHRLICGDSTQHDTFERLFGQDRADMVLTDPPYNVDYSGKTKKALKIENDKMGDNSFYQFLFDFYANLGAFAKAGGAWYVWHADSEGANFRSAMKDAGIMVKQCLIWVKNTMVMGRQDYQWQHEPCLYGWKEGAAHKWFSDRKQTTILRFDRPTSSQDHPTMKPVKLFAYQIENSSKQGDIVADAFGGSGTTMVASHHLKRKGYLVEFDPRYCQVIVDRMQALDPTLVIKKNGRLYGKGK